MALHLYHDAAATQVVDAANPDTIRQAVISGNNMVDEKVLYLASDDPSLTYENISITAAGDEDAAANSGEVDVEYALDNAGSPGVYVDTLNLPNGDYATPVPIWRRVTAPNVIRAFERTDIEHVLSWDEYMK